MISMPYFKGDEAYVNSSVRRKVLSKWFLVFSLLKKGKSSPAIKPFVYEGKTKALPLRRQNKSPLFTKARQKSFGGEGEIKALCLRRQNKSPSVEKAR